MSLTIHIPGKPKAKERPRMTRTGHTYTPKATVDYEKHVAECAREAMGGLPPFEGQLYVSIAVHGDEVFVKVSEWPDEIASKLRGDLDNYMKSVLDGLQGVVFVNDKQVTDLHGTKR